jgi:glucose/arabinose dehydrogenase
MNHEGVSRKRTLMLLGSIAALLVVMLAVFLWRVQHGAVPGVSDNAPIVPAAPLKAPELDKQVVLDGLTNVWDIGFLPDNTMLFTERAGTISKLADGKKVVVATVPGVLVQGESGLMGLAVDPDFANNRYIYVCHSNTNPKDMRVSRWRVDEAVTALTNQTTILNGKPIYFAGRHSGCRPRFGADGYLWIGTGDEAIGANPQDPKSLSGKILHVDRDGKPAPGNLPAPFDPRIFSYGHRNVQGLAMLPRVKYGVYGYSVEHGSDRDDEVDQLRSGNMGWNPVPGYNEAVSMTDKTKYPDAIDPIWTSGETTIAPSGMTFLLGEKWQLYEGRLAMAILKDKQLRLLELDDQGKLKGQETLLKDEYGRLRSAVLSANGDLYLSTDNGSGKDQIIRITPK